MRVAFSDSSLCGEKELSFHFAASRRNEKTTKKISCFFHNSARRAEL